MNDLDKFKSFLNDMEIEFEEKSEVTNGKTYTGLEIDRAYIYESYGNIIIIDFIDGKFK